MNGAAAEKSTGAVRADMADAVIGSTDSADAVFEGTDGGRKRIRRYRFTEAEMLPMYLRLTEALGSFSAGLLLSLVRPAVFGTEGSPFGLGAACAAWLTGRRIALIYALSGTMLGALICADWYGLCAAVFFAALCFFVQLIRWKGEFGIWAKIGTVSAVQLVLIPIFCTLIGDYGVIKLVFQACLAALSAWVLYGAGQAVKRRRQTPHAELTALEYAFFAVSLFLPAAALGGARVFGVGLFPVFGGIFSLWAVAANGIDALFLAASLFLGNAVGLSGNAAGDAKGLFSGLCLFSGILAAVPMKRLSSRVTNSKRLSAAAYFAGFSAAWLLLAKEVSLSGVLSMLFEAALPAAVLLIMPDEVYLLSELGTEREKRSAAKELRRQRLIVGRIAELSERLSEADGDAEFYKRQLSGISRALSELCAEREKKTAAYRLSSGFATEKKHGSEASGDSAAVVGGGDTVLLMLSDGMGSGTEARRESRLATELLTAFSEAGFPLKCALEGVNGILAASGERAEMYATMDVLLFDKTCGTAKFAKFGAPPSYVIRDGRVYTLYAETLPAGIVDGAAPALRSVKLVSGDTVVLMTDGLFDALGSTLTATLLDKCCAENTETDAARAIMEVCTGSGRAEDDMSVLVARIV